MLCTNIELLVVHLLCPGIIKTTAFNYEIRAYADVMIDSLKKWVPITFDAFMDYRVGGMELSEKRKNAIQKMIKGQPCDFEKSKLSIREWNELMNSFGFKEKIK